SKGSKLDRRVHCWNAPFAVRLQTCGLASSGEQRGLILHLTKARISHRFLAERVGFEPTVRLPVQRFSRPSHSTSLAPLRGGHVTCRSTYGNLRTPAKTAKSGERSATIARAWQLTYEPWHLYCPA